MGVRQLSPTTSSPGFCIIDLRLGLAFLDFKLATSLWVNSHGFILCQHATL